MNPKTSKMNEKSGLRAPEWFMLMMLSIGVTSLLYLIISNW